MSNILPQINLKPTSELRRAAEQKNIYEKKLVDKRFLYVYLDNKYILTYKEVMFKRENYLHLVGLDYQNRQSLKRTNNVLIGTNSLEFYDRLGNDKSLINDVSFIIGLTPEDTNLYYKYTQYKLKNLSLLTSIANKAVYVGKYKGNQDFDLIINRSLCSIAFKQYGNTFTPISSLNGKADDVATDICPVVAIFSKSVGQQDYQLEYLNANIVLTNRIIEKTLCDKLSILSFDNPNVMFNKEQLDSIKRQYLYSTKRYISNDLSEIAQLRKEVFTYNEASNAYEGKCKVFRNQLDKDYKAEIAKDILNEQFENETDEKIKWLIESEKKEIPDFGSSSNASSNISKCEFKPLPDNIGTSYDNAVAVLEGVTTFKGLIDRIKDSIKNLFTPKTPQQDKSDNTPAEKEPQEESKLIEDNSSTTTTQPMPKEMTELLEARDSFVQGNISFDEYNQAFKQYLLTLHGEEMWREAAELFSKQLAECPEDKKRCIFCELNAINDNIKKKFPAPLQRWHSMDEIKEFARQQCQKSQSERNVTEKEDTRSTEDYKR